MADSSLSQAKVAQANGVAQTTVAHWLSVVREQTPEALPSHLRNKVERSAPLTLNDILNKPAIQAMFKDPSLTQAKAADLFDTPQPYLSRWLGRIAAEAPELLPEHLKDIKPRLKGNPRPKPNARPSNPSRFAPPSYSYPVYACTRAGAALQSPQPDSGPLGYFASDVEIPTVGHVYPFALRVEGESMVNPLDPHSLYALPDGTDVLINPHIEPDDGDYVAALDLESEGGMIVKKYGWAPTDPANPSGPRERALNSLNPSHAPLLLSAGRYELRGVVVDSRRPSYKRPHKGRA